MEGWVLIKIDTVSVLWMAQKFTWLPGPELIRSHQTRGNSSLESMRVVVDGQAHRHLSMWRNLGHRCRHCWDWELQRPPSAGTQHTSVYTLGQRGPGGPAPQDLPCAHFQGYADGVGSSDLSRRKSPEALGHTAAV